MDYFDIDVYSRKITTSSSDAQLWFDRGLVWTYSYNHELASSASRRPWSTTLAVLWPIGVSHMPSARTTISSGG